MDDTTDPTGTRLSSPGWVLVGSTGLWAADCLRPGCLWTVTTSTPEAADTAAQRHDFTDHPDHQPEFMEDEAA
ncbi:hypothetical protein ACIB24_02455 [Spongisporangium articulatum]|uniref:Uncharacterized protein n=1 Tax=Spongisporangium articulatum TaxID=3362603 RepID=A0ABW8AHT2_9ACTN